MLEKKKKPKTQVRLPGMKTADEKHTVGINDEIDTLDTGEEMIMELEDIVMKLYEWWT